MLRVNRQLALPIMLLVSSNSYKTSFLYMEENPTGKIPTWYAILSTRTFYSYHPNSGLDSILHSQAKYSMRSGSFRFLTSSLLLTPS